MGILAVATTTAEDLYGEDEDTTSTFTNEMTTLPNLEDSNVNNASDIPAVAVDPERLLKEQVCHLYGLSLNDYLNQFVNHNDNDNNQPSSNLSGSIPEDFPTLHPEIDYHETNETVYQGQLNSSFAGLSDLNFDFLPQPETVNSSVCSRMWDGILCWPETPVGHMATLPCFNELNGILYDTSKNATRFCNEGPIWNNTKYDMCHPMSTSSTIDETEARLLALSTGVYFCGYLVSLCAVIIAMIIFLSLKELRCVRNTIHTHLIVTYILADTMWIVTSSTTFSSTSTSTIDFQGQAGGAQTHVSCILATALHFFHLTSFFWSLVEGIYLYVLVVRTFSAEKIKLRTYVAIGWGLPMILVVGWAIVKWLFHPAIAIGRRQSAEAELDLMCLWLVENEYDWIYKGPVIFTLVVNSVFLLQIMWVLITKLRSATNPETQQSMKAAKALLVLMPLLGITYLLLLSGSKEPVYEVTRALLISTQGFMVALLYCFLNGEVRKAVRHRWNTMRSMGCNCNCCDFGRRRRMQNMRDWSPRSRAESIRLYDPSSNPHRKRESSASEATSMTTVHSDSIVNASVNGHHHRLSVTYPNKLYPDNKCPKIKEEASINNFI